ncbi:MAG: chromosomal replication initiator protein DnaA [Treponema sp.]|jgi:chromosomal replication initiator protein|nr:chromosomal replication initiator protein DnaA [Treponema sp.]
MAEWDYEVFWKETLNQIHSELGEQDFSVWFVNLEYLRATENSIILAVPSIFYQDQIKVRYQNLIETSLKDLTGKDLTIIFEVVPRKKTENSPRRNETPAAGAENSGFVSGSKDTAGKTPEKKTRHPQLREDYIFDKYVIGENNSFAANAAIAISRNPGTAYNPFLIYGGVGLGKTHLMQAIGNYVHEDTDSKIIYITAENFLNEYVQGISENKMTAFKNKFRYTDVLLIDDIHFFQDKPGIQEELFHTFNTLLDAKKQLVFTCDRPVSELKKISERLMSRFEQCLKVDLQPPKYETRCAILKSTVESQGAVVPDEVIDLIGKNISSNVRDLISALNKLIAYTRLMGKPITIENAQHQLRDVFASPRQANMSIELIQRVTAEYFSLSPNDLKGKKRTQNIVFPRQLAMYIAREITEYSTTELGQAFGGRDHTTVMHSCQKIEEQIRSDPTMDATIESLKRLIKENGSKT